MKDKLLLHYLQFNFPLTERPFLEIAKNISLSEYDVIKRTRTLKNQGIIKYIGSVLNFNKVGFESTLVALSVPKKDIKRVAKIINGFCNVSHNYLRDDDDFNLWFTLTVPKGKLLSVIKKIKQLTGIKKILNLKTEKVFKIDTRFKL